MGRRGLPWKRTSGSWKCQNKARRIHELSTRQDKGQRCVCELHSVFVPCLLKCGSLWDASLRTQPDCLVLAGARGHLIRSQVCCRRIQKASRDPAATPHRQTQGASPSPPPSRQHRLNGMLNGRLSSSRCYVSGDLVNG